MYVRCFPAVPILTCRSAYGQKWWDANPAGKSGLANRPHLITFEIDDSEIYSLKSRQPIGWNARIKANNLYIADTIVETYTTGGYPFNSMCLNPGSVTGC